MSIYNKFGVDSSRSLRLRLPLFLVWPEIVAGLSTGNKNYGHLAGPPGGRGLFSCNALIIR
jgi:hypothetical protein